jgi:glutathione-regulated potassium-efflux system ancillary protein KefG
MPIAKRILVLLAHPALHRSRVNSRLAEAVRDLDEVTIEDLYENYPEFDIDVRREQRSLEEHDIVVLQHPFYWYSAPALVKQWQDLVLEHGWAYGREGHALEGKTLLCAISAGGSEAAYQRDGHNRFTIRELLAPFEQTARLCGMTYLPPFVVYGTHQLSAADITGFATDYRHVILALRDGRLDNQAAAGFARLNTALEAVIRHPSEPD